MAKACNENKVKKLEKEIIKKCEFISGNLNGESMKEYLECLVIKSLEKRIELYNQIITKLEVMESLADGI